MTSVTPRVVSLLGAALVAALVCATVPFTWPGHASPLLGEEQGQAQRPRSSYGHTSAPDGTLRRGCHDYRYRYALTPPTGDWILETFLRGPDGEGLSSDVFAAGADRRTSRETFRFCRYSTRPGRFTIRAKLQWYDDDNEQHAVWLEPSHFRLRKPR